jgi:predicted DNA-binding protein
MKEDTTAKYVTISAQIPLRLAELLEKFCQMQERPKSYFVRKALEHLLEFMQEEDNVTVLHKKNDKKNN